MQKMKCMSCRSFKLDSKFGERCHCGGFLYEEMTEQGLATLNTKISFVPKSPNLDIKHLDIKNEVVPIPSNTWVSQGK